MFGTQPVPHAQAPAAPPATIRLVVPADVPALRQFFTGLSMQSRYQRFFGPIGTPNPPLLDLLAGGPSHVDAVVATAGGAIIGHAMAADQAGPDGEHRTDIGVVVADAWQGHGVGVALMRSMIDRAQARGVSVVVMDVLHDNYRALAMITDHWARGPGRPGPRFRHAAPAAPRAPGSGPSRGRSCGGARGLRASG